MEKNVLKNNGADDWLLWILLFSEKAVFGCNSRAAYIHNDAQGSNLSADLAKMKESAKEMVDILKDSNLLEIKELNRLKDTIEFKYKQDSKELNFTEIIMYRKVIADNILHKIRKSLYSFYKN